MPPCYSRSMVGTRNTNKSGYHKGGGNGMKIQILVTIASTVFAVFGGIHSVDSTDCGQESSVTSSVQVQLKI